MTRLSSGETVPGAAVAGARIPKCDRVDGALRVGHSVICSDANCWIVATPKTHWEDAQRGAPRQADLVYLGCLDQTYRRLLECLWEEGISLGSSYGDTVFALAALYSIMAGRRSA